VYRPHAIRGAISIFLVYGEEPPWLTALPQRGVFRLKVRSLNPELAPYEFVHQARLPKKPLPKKPNCGCWASRMGCEP
jgi:hypothetical protein